MRISLIGNCQCDSLAACLRAMLPAAQIDTYMIHELTGDPDRLVRILADSDHVFAQTSARPHIAPASAHKVAYFPTIAFSAYHPDLTFVRGRKGGGEVETVSSPLSGYHSLIAAFGYANAIGIEDILSFYHAGVYGRLCFFNRWDHARKELLEEGVDTGMPLNALFERWRKGDAFMHSSNHPTLRVMEDIARTLLRRIGLGSAMESVDPRMADPLKAMPIWPIYPEIAERLGVEGSMIFRPHEPESALSLRQFVESSYDCFAPYDRDSIDTLSLPVSEVGRRLGFAGEAPPLSTARNPYAEAPKVQFWKHSVAAIEPIDLDPVVSPRFAIGSQERVATAGSCFAQHIARTLKGSGFNYFVAENAPPGMSEGRARELNYGTFSARFGNIYTVRQLRQLIERAEGDFVPRTVAWESSTPGRVVDPFRPQIVPHGFDDERAMLAARDEHLACVRSMLREMDVFVFTLGLTEGWQARFDGAAFPLAPGVAGGRPDPDEYEFVNFDIDQIRDDLHEVIARIHALNPSCKIVLTVSPVPLIATFEPRHALVATTYSKSVLRVVADEMWRKYDHVDYFPSYEIITGNFNRGAYFAENLRDVTEAGVSHAMRVFMANYANAPRPRHPRASNGEKSTSRNPFFDVVCDEEEIAKF
jgi:hypothetical protein